MLRPHIRRIFTVNPQDAEKVALSLVASAFDPRHKQSFDREKIKQLCDTVPDTVGAAEHSDIEHGDSQSGAATALHTLSGEDYRTSEVCLQHKEIESYLTEPNCEV